MGQGIISVSSAMFEEREQPRTLAEWHALLMLPVEYRVLEAKADAMYPLWLITVENDAIPVVKGKKLSKGYYLERIEIDKPKKRVIWSREEQA
jgi:hypothetical protein